MEEKKKKDRVTDREKGTEEEREQAEQTPRDGDDSKSRFHHIIFCCLLCIQDCC